jgi:excisionase family DNA binding protein
MSHLPVSQRDWMFPREAAEVLQISPKTLSNWVRRGQLTCTKTIGGHRRYAKAEIHRAKAIKDLEPTQGGS